MTRAGRLLGKTAIVTGAASGLGFGTAELFAAEGATVLALDIDDVGGERIAARNSDRIHYRRCDVRDEDALAAAFDICVERFGGLDIVNHSAATSGAFQLIGDLARGDWEDSVETVLTASLFVVKHGGRVMRGRGGSIILTASASGISFGTRTPSSYSINKAAVVALAKKAALELAEHCIRVNVIAPGGIPTPMILGGRGLDRATMDRAIAHLGEGYAAYQPLPYAGRPEDIAEAALFLGSDGARWITGATLPVDGGLTLERKMASAQVVPMIDAAVERALRESNQIEQTGKD